MVHFRTFKANRLIRPEVSRTDRYDGPALGVVSGGGILHHWRLGFKQCRFHHIARALQDDGVHVFGRLPLYHQAMFPLSFRRQVGRLALRQFLLVLAASGGDSLHSVRAHGAILESAFDVEWLPFFDVLAGDLGEFVPADHGVELGGFLPVDDAVGGQSNIRNGLPRAGVPQFGIPGGVADQDDFIDSSHIFILYHIMSTL